MFAHMSILIETTCPHVVRRPRLCYAHPYLRLGSLMSASVRIIFMDFPFRHRLLLPVHNGDYDHVPDRWLSSVWRKLHARFEGMAFASVSVSGEVILEPSRSRRITSPRCVLVGASICGIATLSTPGRGTANQKSVGAQRAAVILRTYMTGATEHFAQPKP